MIDAPSYCKRKIAIGWNCRIEIIRKKLGLVLDPRWRTCHSCYALAITQTASQTSSPSILFLLTLQPQSEACLLFLRHSKHTPTLGPFYLLFTIFIPFAWNSLCPFIGMARSLLPSDVIASERPPLMIPIQNGSNTFPVTFLSLSCFSFFLALITIW